MMTRDQLAALVASESDRVEIEAETFLELARRAPPRSLLANFAASFAGRTKPVVVSRETARQLLAILDEHDTY